MATEKLIGSKLYRHEIVREVLDYDDAETNGWKWKDYVWLSEETPASFEARIYLALKNLCIGVAQ